MNKHKSKTVISQVLGMIENMSHFTCPNCGTKSSIFGSGKIEKLAMELKVDLIGESAGSLI